MSNLDKIVVSVENNIQNQFCSYKIALALKELGFNHKCIAMCYIKDGSEFTIDEGAWRYAEISKEILPIPLWGQIIDWFKTEYNFDVYVKPYYYNHNQYKWNIKTNWGRSYRRNNFFDCTLYSTLYEAREKAILKSIELVNERNKPI